MSWENPKLGEKPNQLFLERIFMIIQYNHEQAIFTRENPTMKKP
jgi:hypothetical protein